MVKHNYKNDNKITNNKEKTDGADQNKNPDFLKFNKVLY